MPHRYYIEPAWHGWLFPLIALLLLALGVVLLFLLFRRMTSPGATGTVAPPTAPAPSVPLAPVSRQPDALESAALRLGRGEITLEEFDQIRDRLAPAKDQPEDES